MLKAQLIGYVGKDAVVSDYNGRKVINFNVAHSEKYKDAQGVQHERTTWVSCGYWTDKTGVAQYLRKGTLVYVEGLPVADYYINPQRDGDISPKLKFTVWKIELLGGTKDNANSAPPAQTTSTPPPETSFNDDDLPF